MDYRVLIATPLAALVLSVGATELRMPHHWMPQKLAIPANPIVSTTADYEIGLDPRDLAAGAHSLTVKSVGALNDEYVSMGAALQVAHGYGAKRVRLSGQVRTEGVRNWAGLFIGPGGDNLGYGLRIGTPDAPLPMGAAAPAPNADWQDLSVVVQLPVEADDDLVLGVVLVGEGQVWARQLRFEVVGPEVPLTVTTVGFDWAKTREASAQSRKLLLALPPARLTNAALD